MYVLDYSYESPADNLACDEALLQAWETEQRTEGLLRFWESPIPFVVLGLSNAVKTEVNVDACTQDGIPILRRCSGGGTVLQGPGCLNYAVVLPISAYPVSTITETNHFVMGMMKTALSGLTPGVQVQGYTDLTLDGLKFSGNAQRRLKHAVLFHGTVLYSAEMGPLISTYLSMPSKAPDYREGRSHSDFIRPFSASTAQIKAAVMEAWSATSQLASPISIPEPLQEKYRDEAWHFRV